MLSDKDQDLLALLKQDARISVAALARKLGLSRTATQARLERLEAQGVIAGYAVKLGRAVTDHEVRALVMIKAPAPQRGGIEAALNRIPALRSLHSVSGVYDMAAFLAAQSVRDLDQVIDTIGQLDGVQDTLSSVILATKIERD